MDERGHREGESGSVQGMDSGSGKYDILLQPWQCCAVSEMGPGRMTKPMNTGYIMFHIAAWK